MKIFTVITLLVFAASQGVFAWGYRVNQMPNGSVFGCANCHINPSGGGARNDYGKQIAASHLEGGNLVWSPELAALDADGDGATNGKELQDPDGSWRIGDAEPGDAELVTNPGDASSVPVDSRVKSAGFDRQPDQYVLEQNYPNPFNPTTHIVFRIPEGTHVSLRVFNISGEPVKTLVDGFFQKGEYGVTFNGLDNSGQMLSSGLYIYRMKAGRIIRQGRMILIK